MEYAASYVQTFCLIMCVFGAMYCAAKIALNGLTVVVADDGPRKAMSLIAIAIWGVGIYGWLSLYQSLAASIAILRGGA